MPDRRLAQVAGAIYGTILITALVTALSEDEEADPTEIALAAVLTSFVFWLAHVYARVLAGSVGDRRFTWADARDTALEEWPMVQSAVPAVAALLLGPIGVVSNYTAESLAIGAGIAALFFWGVVLGRRRGLTLLGQLLVASVNVAFGAAIVAMKIAIH
jgi:hypothetical protein